MPRRHGAKEAAGKRDGTAGPTRGEASRSGPAPQRRSAASAPSLPAKSLWPAARQNTARPGADGPGAAAGPCRLLSVETGGGVRTQPSCSSLREERRRAGGRTGARGARLHPCSAILPPVRRRTPLSPEALCPAPARVIGRLLARLSRGRKWLMVPGAAPHPHLDRTGASRYAALLVVRTVGGARDISRAPRTVPRLSAMAIAMAGDPQAVCGAAT